MSIDGFGPGTYAYYYFGGFEEQLDVKAKTTLNCSAAVNSWKKAKSEFGNSPPPFLAEEDKEDPYTNAKFSYVALYNPNTPPVADCKILTCDFKKKDVEDTVYKTYSLICKTSPNAFADPNARPFP